MLYWFFKWLALGPLLKVLFRPWVEGEEHVPPRGAAILASNHLSFSDSFFLPLVLSRRITFPAKMEYFTGSGVKGRLTAAFFRGVGQIPIDRSGGKASSAALRSGLEVLQRGELFGIYPEGTRSPDGRLYRGKTGVARLALEAGVPVIPVAMIGTDKAQPTGQLIPTVTRIGVRFGAPIDFSRYAGMQHDRHVLRAMTDEIMYALMELSGQEYVDEYAATRKQRMVESARARADEALLRARELQDQTRVKADEALERARELGDPARLKELGDQTRAMAEEARSKAEEALAKAKDRRSDQD
ncbi:lysophospholipid acyltransferase family protein [Arsenicicoccus sp. oral taxon 190]|uniref:lysophospholipid acyltransferase family protein n=1 Tax=Arsenicicoccus sp. oral taxon 190 TaxID=1658671 RepID=UPI0009E5A07C|nr:lysophospholipid acyltransferase family protein [Arsenicicoccus sp. oral taxon 190]